MHVSHIYSTQLSQKVFNDSYTDWEQKMICYSLWDFLNIIEFTKQWNALFFLIHFFWLSNIFRNNFSSLISKSWLHFLLISNICHIQNMLFFQIKFWQEWFWRLVTSDSGRKTAVWSCCDAGPFFFSAFFGSTKAR